MVVSFWKYCNFQHFLESVQCRYGGYNIISDHLMSVLFNLTVCQYV